MFDTLLTTDFEALLTHFHWQRPLWLIATPIAVLATIWLWKQQYRQSGWQQLIPDELLQHLLQGETHKMNRFPLLGLAAIWFIGSLALAGPSWEKIPQPIHKSEQALVVLLDLSPSMLAQDLKPSRLVRARLKLIDYLKQRGEGLTALVVFAGEAHVITPLTDDTRTISSLVPSLSPNIMPLGGSNPEMAVDLALQLLADAGVNKGELLMVTDGLTNDAIASIQKQLNQQHPLSILGVGTDQGAPIPIDNGGFAKDSRGGIVLAKLNSRSLSQLSRSQNGQYRTLSATNEDIDALALTPELLDNNTREVSREFDHWLDRGPWVSLLLLPLVLLCFRRGWLISALLTAVLVGLPNPRPVMALEWQDLWKTQDQQAQELLRQGDPSAAAEKFNHTQWSGTAHYQANQYDKAIEAFAQENSPATHFNRGNALAKSGQLKEAIKAYEQALKNNPDLEDAQYNKTLVEELLKQQQNNQQQNGSSEDNKQDSNEQGEGEQNQEGQQSNQQQDQQGQQEPGDSNQENGKSNQDQQNQNPEDQQSDSQESNNQDTEDQPSSEQQNSPQEQQPTNDPSESEEQSDSQQANGEPENLSQEDKEQQQAMEQWLRKVPDDPSGLMRKKFEYQHFERRKQYQQGTWEPPKNNATERW